MASAFRFLALIWNVADEAASASANRIWAQKSKRACDWEVVLDAPGLRVVAKLPAVGSFRSHLLPGESGVVLGTLFPSKIRAGDGDRILATRGQYLFDRYWGRYVAFLRGREPAAQWLLKDPTGRLPCFVWANAGLTFAFSCLQDVIELNEFQFSINPSYLAYRVACGSGRPDDTGIQGISEVCGGERLEFRSGNLSRQLLWDPALLAQDAIEDADLAAQMIRETVTVSIHSWAAAYEVWLHRLSGGLDSSIVLACLASAPCRPRIVAVTYCWEGSPSNEMPWARMASEHGHVRHLQHSRTEHLSFEALPALRALASPPGTTSFLELSQVERDLTAEHGATVVSTGDGGDSLFGSTAARFAVSDFLQGHGLRPRVLRLASDVALLRNQTVWQVLAQAFSSGKRRYRDRNELGKMREARQMVSPETRDPLLPDRGAIEHPWFRSGTSNRGVREILAYLTGPDLFYDPIRDPDSDHLDSLSPLLSQPLVELCVRIPSYVHFDRGRDRGLVRRAFAGVVPNPILQRTWKDRVQGFPEQIFRANLHYFRFMLLDGILVKERYLDRRAVERTLGTEDLKSTASAGEILDHVLVEAWLRSCLDRGIRPV